MEQLSVEALLCPKTDIISVFITNLGKYNEGELVGEWHSFPTTSEALQSCFERIGIDGVCYEEYFLTDYESSIEGVTVFISEYSRLDELNYLAMKLADLSDDDIRLYCASLVLGNEISTIADLINLTDNLDGYQLLDDVNNEYDLGYYWIELSGCYDLTELGCLSHYIDYERYGRDVFIEQNGTFCDAGYIYHTGESVEPYYDGKNIPDIYRP